MRRHEWKRETASEAQWRLLVKRQWRDARRAAGLARRWEWAALTASMGTGEWETCRQRQRRLADANRLERVRRWYPPGVLEDPRFELVRCNGDWTQWILRERGTGMFYGDV